MVREGRRLARGDVAVAVGDSQPASAPGAQRRSQAADKRAVRLRSVRVARSGRPPLAAERPGAAAASASSIQRHIAVWPMTTAATAASPGRKEEENDAIWRRRFTLSQGRLNGYNGPEALRPQNPLQSNESTSYCKQVLYRSTHPTIVLSTSVERCPASRNPRSVDSVSRFYW